MKSKRCILSGMVTALLALVILPSFAWAGDELVIYSGRSDKFVTPVVEAFTKATGIKVQLHSAESTALLNKLKLEGDRTQADLYLSNDAGNLQRGADEGLFAPVPKEIAEQIPPDLRAADNTWLGLSARARVLVVNKNSPLAGSVKSVFDLARPELKGRIGITNSANESFIAGVTVYMLKKGKEQTRQWLEGLKRNAEGSVFGKHSKIVKAVAEGKKEIGLVNHYYVFRHLAKDPDAPIEVIMPDQGKDGMGVAWNVAGVAITRYSRHPEQALKFVRFLVSEEGQRIFADANREYPTRKGVPAAEGVPPLDTYTVASVPMADLAKYRDETINLIEEVGLP